MVQAHNQIAATLKQRASGNAPPQMAIGLARYIRLHGNPLANNLGHTIISGFVHDEVTLQVLASNSCNGRHSLSGIVSTSSDGLSSDTLARLSRMSIDNVETLKVVKNLVVEYVCRESLKRQVLPPRPQGGVGMGLRSERSAARPHRGGAAHDPLRSESRRLRLQAVP